MDADVVAVLVVPAPGDPGRLLARGACGSSPPVAHEAGRWSTPTWMEGRDPDGPMFNALPLWWEGRLVEEGWSRLAYAEDRLSPDRPGVLPRRRRQISLWPDLEAVLALADGSVLRGIASRVIRLVRVDGRLVELEPVGVGT